MLNRLENTEHYDAIMRSSLIQYSVLAAALVLLFIILLVQTINMIRQGRTKKWPYAQLVGYILIFTLIGNTVGSRVICHAKDISEQAYIQYEGAATTKLDRTIVGGVTHNNHTISFESNGKQVELFLEETPPFIGNFNEVYLVYAKRSRVVLEIKYVD